MTLRRLGVLVSALPPDAHLWAVLRAAEEKANKPTPDLIRERQEAWRRHNEAALAREEVAG